MSRIRFEKCLVVANPIAGRGRGERAAHAAVDGLAALGIKTTLHLTRARGDARERCRGIDATTDLVVSIGGDGTLSEVLDGLTGHDVPVAVLALGTANVLALDLGLARDVPALMRTITHGREQQIDVARIDGQDGREKRLSFLVVGVGFDAMVVRALERLRTGAITKRTWIRAALSVWWNYRAPRITVEVDGRTIAGEHGFVLVSNIVHYAGWRSLAGDRVLDDGLFEVYLFAHGSRTALIGYGLRALFSTFPGGSVTRVRGRRVHVSSSEPVPYQVDGDLAGLTPFTFEVVPPVRRILVP